MAWCISLILISVLILIIGIIFNPLGPVIISSDSAVDPGEPLILTPYLDNASDIEKARELSKVSILGLDSYAGYFTVNPKYDGNMYFWFFKAKIANPTSVPLVLWLQGGPGASSLFGLFNENGPIMVTETGEAVFRDVTWNNNYNMLYIDNPIGTGFSFVNDTAGIPTTEPAVATDLYNCLMQFFTLFPDFIGNQFFITGESYGGKYIPALSYKIDQENSKSPAIKINLSGFAIGDGLIDPENMMGGYGDLFFQMGLVDENEKKVVDNYTTKAVDFMKAGTDEDYLQAATVIGELISGSHWPYPTYFLNVTKMETPENILEQFEPPVFRYYISYIETNTTRKDIHVGMVDYGAQDGDVATALQYDEMQSMKANLSYLLDAGYKTLIYTGQLDVEIGVTMTERFLQVLQWEGLADYLAAEKRIWCLDNGDLVSGYIRSANNNLYQVVVRGAGHIAPHDQPERMQNLIDLFISGNISVFDNSGNCHTT